MLKRLALLATLALAPLVGASAPASAQCPGVNCTVPNQGLAYIAKQKTYNAISIGLVPAASATDILCLNQSATKAVHLDQVVVSGSAGTAITTPVVVKLNHSLDTGGTPATGLALPAPAAANSADPAATATLTAYTANPTIPDSTPAYLGAQAISFAVTTTANTPTQFLPSTASDIFNKGWDMPALATPVQQICLNLNATTITTGVLAIWVEWTESP